ncbi:uncharacterized protein RCC_08022 [Ramularia collo-cygni]|uniref:Uncharacterized protein n=1 Tax=Ramularia collo-cygni TaxID=112498 RepID=A0A2D3VLM5_9PEZI|nr:uncharacterized protein RCC_08022 [Ramularia collo-cygni]CZT22153.1 uncharacterized protein RCC_08022 [Ramularia collo-cygni]
MPSWRNRLLARLREAEAENRFLREENRRLREENELFREENELFRDGARRSRRRENNLLWLLERARAWIAAFLLAFWETHDNIAEMADDGELLLGDLDRE